MKKNIIIALILLLGLVQGAWATAYQFYIVEREGKTLTFKGTDTAPSADNHQYSIDKTYDGKPYWAQDVDNWNSITEIVFDPSFAECRPTSTFMWFAHKPYLTSIKGMREYLNTSEVTDMAMMFYQCSCLTTLDLMGFNTSKVADMSRMFEGCGSLLNIYVGSEWTTSNVHYTPNEVDDMFKGCSNLRGQDGTGYDSNKTSKDYAHYGAGGYLISEAHYWSTRIAESFFDVSGTTITIRNMGEMKLLAKNVNNGTNYSSYTFLLAKDLALDPTLPNSYTPIGNVSNSFTGTFDGQGHTISGINLNGEGCQALFGAVRGGTVKNLTLDASTINNTNNSSAAGIVATIMSGETTI